ncbi:MAG TPA: hypothetical protein VGN51_15745 [Acidimicrobiia bacterium]|jgi:hypothetical protein
MAREPWYRRAARGALAGAGATVAMSTVQFPGALAVGRFPPPVEITRRLQQVRGRRPDRHRLFARAAALHLAFGAGCGALYAVVAPRRFRELSAIAFAGVIYEGSYRASLPALRLHPHTADDHTSRQVSNVAGHLIYGLTLAELLRLTDPHDDQTEDHEV